MVTLFAQLLTRGIWQYGYFKLIHFSKKSGHLLSMSSEILDFSSHYSANFQPMLDRFISKFKLFADLENIKTVVFNLLQMKQSKFFGGHLVSFLLKEWNHLYHQCSNGKLAP